MRILLVSDLHYSLPQFDWLVRVAPQHDLIVLAGDCLDIASTVPLDVQTTVVLRYLALLRQATRVAVASGNHDLTGPDAGGEQAALWLAQAGAGGVDVDGGTLELAGTRLTICPWWDGPLGRARLEARLADEATRRTGRWIWVYHWPPLGSSTCWTGKRDYGDADVGAWIDRFQPDLVLAGHVHEPPFKPTGSWADRRGKTWIFNAGRQIGPVPAHVRIDLDRGEADWSSMMGTEALRLTDPAPPPRTVF